MNEELASDCVRSLVRLLVDEPDEVEIEEIPFRGGVILSLEVAPDDLGKVIGRQGRTVRSLRTLLAARTRGEGERHELEIAEV